MRYIYSKAPLFISTITSSTEWRQSVETISSQLPYNSVIPPPKLRISYSTTLDGVVPTAKQLPYPILNQYHTDSVSHHNTSRMCQFCHPISHPIRNLIRVALAQLGERQTEENFGTVIWRHCVRSTEATYFCHPFLNILSCRSYLLRAIHR